MDLSITAKSVRLDMSLESLNISVFLVAFTVGSRLSSIDETIVETFVAFLKSGLENE